MARGGGWQPPEAEAEDAAGLRDARAGCRGGGYPRTSPDCPARPLPTASAARPGAGSRARAGSPQPQQGNIRDTAAPGSSPRPAGGKRRRWHLVPSEGGRMLWSCSSSLTGLKSQIQRGGEAAEMELLETPFRSTSWAVSDLPHSAWEDGAETRLQSAKPTEAQSVPVFTELPAAWPP